jgi:hypothetical protein
MTHDEHEARQAAVSKALSEPLHVTNWRPLLAPEDVARLIDTAAALRAAEAENERLRGRMESLAGRWTHTAAHTGNPVKQTTLIWCANELDAARKEAGNE